jgi:SAM-dependent methyltransferase
MIFNVETKRSLIKKIGAAISKKLQSLIVLIERQRTTYQPVPWLGTRQSKREASTIGRWNAIEQDLSLTKGNVIDIGCNVGYFTMKFAEKDFFSLGIDGDSENIYVANLARQVAKVEKVAFMNSFITPDNINELPKADVITFFSVWHHWIGLYGLDQARNMLATLWSKTNHTLYFEGGEDTEIASLDVTLSPQQWIEQELLHLCEGATLTVLGRFDSGTHKEQGYRTLIALKK